jgi:hypothetical protein
VSVFATAGLFFKHLEAIFSRLPRKKLTVDYTSSACSIAVPPCAVGREADDERGERVLLDREPDLTH